MLDDLLNQLTDPDNQDYEATLAHIKTLGHAVVPALLDNLHTLDSSKALAVVYLLGKIGGSPAIEALYKILLNHHPADEDYIGLNDEAANMLLALNALDADHLMPHLRHPDPIVRGNAAFYLHWVRDSAEHDRIVTALLPLASDPDADVRNTVALVLSELGDPRSAQALLAILRRATSTGHCWNALRAIKNVPDRGAVEAIVPFLEDADADVSGEAASALGAIGDGRALEPLFDLMLRDYERSYASGALARLENVVEAADRLLAIVADDRQPRSLRCRASEVLGHTGDERAVVPLAPLLTHNNLHLRNSAIWGLTELGFPEAAPALIPCLEDEVDWVRQSAMEAFGHIISQDAVEPLLASLHRENYFFERLCLVRALRHQADARAVKPLRDLLTHLESDASSPAQQLMDELHLTLQELENRVT
jgi:HEAT repeat protein